MRAEVIHSKDPESPSAHEIVLLADSPMEALLLAYLREHGVSSYCADLKWGSKRIADAATFRDGVSLAIPTSIHHSAVREESP